GCAVPFTGEDSQGVSWQHARIDLSAAGAVLVDLQSRNGTFVNDCRIQDPTPLQPGQYIGLGQTGPVLKVASIDLSPVQVSALPPPQARGQQPGPAVPFRGSSLVFGRDPRCDQPLDYPMISWHHARLSRAGRDFLLEDLRSTNGTFVNGRRAQRVIVRAGD